MNLPIRIIMETLGCDEVAASVIMLNLPAYFHFNSATMEEMQRVIHAVQDSLND